MADSCENPAARLRGTQHPGFIAPYLLALHLAISQFGRHDAISYSLTDKSMPLQFLVLFVAFLLLRCFFRIPTNVLIIVTLCLVGGAYFAAGWAKLTLPGGPLTWLTENRLDYLFVSSHLNGWLSSWHEETILAVAGRLKPFNLLLGLLTLATELGVVCFLLDRRWTLGLLLVSIAMHIGILAASGIFFWKWIALDLALAIYLAKGPKTVTAAVFGRRNLVIGMLVIGLNSWLFDFTALGWYDSPVNQHYEIDVIGVSGRRYEVARNFFAPYDIPFAQARFNYLNERSHLVGTYGTMMDFDSFRAVEEGGRGRVVELLAADLRPPDADRSAGLEEFLRRFFAALNRRGNKKTIFSVVRAPNHILSTVPEQHRYAIQEPVRKVLVRYVESYYDGRSVETLQEEVVLVVDVPADLSSLQD